MGSSGVSITPVLVLVLLITTQIPRQIEGESGIPLSVYSSQDGSLKFSWVVVSGRAGHRALFFKVKGEGEEKILVGAIGSRPPRCDGMCMACRRCEAVQVPVAPLHRKVQRFLPAWFGFRGEDGGSNYKPLSWKCRCGDVIFNP